MIYCYSGMQDMMVYYFTIFHVSLLQIKQDDEVARRMKQWGNINNIRYVVGSLHVRNQPQTYVIQILDISHNAIFWKNWGYVPQCNFLEFPVNDNISSCSMVSLGIPDWPTGYLYTIMNTGKWLAACSFLIEYNWLSRFMYFWHIGGFCIHHQKRYGTLKA